MALAAIIISLLALLGSIWSLYLQNEAHRREKRKEEKERKSDTPSLKVELSKHSSFKLLKLMNGRQISVPLNCFFINDGVKTIYLKNLRLEVAENGNWKTLLKKNYLNGIPESIIEPGPKKHIVLRPQINSEQILALEGIVCRIKIETTTGGKFYSQELVLGPNK